MGLGGDESHNEGKMPEWSIGAVSKTVVPSGTQGSNPCLSAKHERKPWDKIPRLFLYGIVENSFS